MLQLGKIYLMDDFLLMVGVFALTVSEVLNKYELMFDWPYIDTLTVVARIMTIVSASIIIYPKVKAWIKKRNEKPK